MKKGAVALVILTVLAPATAHAEGELPEGLVQAIIRHESGFNPLAINVAGKTHHPATRAEAEAIIQAAQESGRTFDVGLMQINSWWMKRYGIQPASLLDPAINSTWGKWILSQEIARHCQSALKFDPSCAFKSDPPWRLLFGARSELFFGGGKRGVA